MSRVPLRPAAGPVDPFERKEIRQPTQDTRLAEIASALSGLAPSLSRFAANQLERDRLAGETEAEAQFAELSRQYDNMDAFRQAVESGQIHRYDNPWTSVFLKQMVVRDQVRQAGAELENRFQSDADFRDSGEAAVDSAVLERMDQILTGASPFALRGAMPEVSRVRDKLRAAAADHRRNQVATQSASLLNRELQRVLHDTGRRLAAQQGPWDAASAAADLQSVLDAGTVAGLDPEKLRSFATSSVFEFAKTAGLRGFAEETLKSLSVGGVSLYEGNQTALMELEKEIDHGLYREFVEAKQREERLERELAEQAIEMWLQNPESVTDLNELPPAAREFALAQLDKAQRIQRDADAAAIDAEANSGFMLGVEGVVSGDATMVTSAEMALLSLGLDGMAAYEKLQKIKGDFSSEAADFPSVSDTATRINLGVQLSSQSGLSPQQKVALLEENRGLISREDYIALQSLIQTTTTGTPYRERAAYQDKMFSVAGDMLKARLIETGAYSPSIASGLPATGQEILDAQTALLRLDIVTVLDGVLAENPEITEPQFKQLATERLNEMFASKYSLPTLEEHAEASRRAAKLFGVPLTELDEGQKRLAVESGQVKVRWDSSKQKTVLDQTGEPIDFPLAPDTRSLLSNLQSIMLMVGITPDTPKPEVDQFLIEQARALMKKDPRAISAIYKLTRGMFEPEEDEDLSSARTWVDDWRLLNPAAQREERARARAAGPTPEWTPEETEGVFQATPRSPKFKLPFWLEKQEDGGYILRIRPRTKEKASE